MKSTTVVLIVSVVALVLLYLFPVPSLLTGVLLCGMTAGKGRSRYGRKF